MTPTRKKRLAIVLLIVLGVSAATAVAISAMSDSMLYFVSPSDVVAQAEPLDRRIRLGGLVADGSVQRASDSLAVTFAVTDGANQVPVAFTGILPDLFREGQGVIAHGRLDADGVFQADEILARHDETYMPPEVMRALEEAGHPIEASQP
ncbi:cytochrome c maturation protein CcmE [Wenzhouxiangella marina]|uniref:Cytochrome c-type biogenesis protein CcmE n=1 Tax=Wenzhouxiangella marina TaxID=1579979 RepID=A0A0K0XXV2_9GAMM|nr:cytochrome c maturation protein CcmE [Wenzhouxiangella marina]AKS42505.1 Cytochrome c-type biogenesis protein CcmE [Wenzhouxiangella marina]MBB6085719.1 cytochrome c-type biogenesis protein CcmE [Wenzhouxiangella marina]